MRTRPDTAGFRLAGFRLAGFRLKLSPLTPFTVGSGRVLNRFDFILLVNPRSGAPLIRVLDLDRFIDGSPLSPEKKAEAIEKRSTGVLERFSRYVLSSSFREAREDLELREFHRDPQGRPVVPASSLRGMVRTAVAFALVRSAPEALGEGIEAALSGRWRRDRVAERLERRLFGRSERDALRCLRISEPGAASNDDLKAYQVAVMNLAGGPPRPKTSLYLEAVDPRSGVSFEYEASLDRAALCAGDPEGPLPAAGAILGGREPLLGAIRLFSEALVEAERRFYAESGARDLGRLLEETLRKAQGRIALPFGFGAGWRSKTMGLLLGPAELNRLAPLLSPGRSYYRRGPTPIFPKTRRWVLEAGRPLEPWGWVTIE